MTDSSSKSIERRAVPAGGVARGSVRLPGSKSLSHRAYAAALLARRPVEVFDPLRADDTELFLAALETLGYRVERRPRSVIIEPLATTPAAGSIDCGNAGTLLRFLTALVATVPGDWRLDGTARLRERPIGPLIRALRSLGVVIECLGREGFPPLLIAGGELGGGRLLLDAGDSSQYLSALLLAGQSALSPIEIEVKALASAPYVGLTLEVIAAFGGTVECHDDRFYRVVPGPLRGGGYRVEADLSAAAYPAAAAALTGGDVLLESVSLASRQGDRRLLELLGEMGAGVEQEATGVRVRGGSLRAIEVDAADIPDQVPTLAALAPFAAGTTRIHNVAHLRIKESDRLAAMASELGRAGAEVEELADGLVVPGIWANRQPPQLAATPVEIDPHNDHRIAMAMTLVGLRRPGLTILRPDVVSKSWPEFWTAFLPLVGEHQDSGSR